MDIIKTLMVKTEKNKYIFNLAKHTYSFFYESAYAYGASKEPEGRFVVYKDMREAIISERTDYVNFYINDTKFVSFAKDAWHDFESLEENYCNVTTIQTPKYIQVPFPADALAIFKVDDFSIKLSKEITFVKTDIDNENLFYSGKEDFDEYFSCQSACDFGVQDESGNYNLHNIVDIARLIAAGIPVLYTDMEYVTWRLYLSDKGKGLLSKHNFVNS